MVHITMHAIERYRERVEDLPEEEVRRRLDTPTIRIAAEFGATGVILPGGHRVAIRDYCVTTVIPKRTRRRQGSRIDTRDHWKEDLR